MSPGNKVPLGGGLQLLDDAAPLIEAKRVTLIRSWFDASDDVRAPPAHDVVKRFVSSDGQGLQRGAAGCVLAASTDRDRQAGGIGDGLPPGGMLAPATDEGYRWRGDVDRRQGLDAIGEPGGNAVDGGPDKQFRLRVLGAQPHH